MNLLLLILPLLGSDPSELPAVDGLPFSPVAELSPIQGDTVSVTYHQFTLFRSGSDTFAIHILPHPKYGEDGITYTWYRLPGGGRDFLSRRVEIGHGEARESGATRIESVPVVQAGTLRMEWSKGNRDSGWLYWRDAPKDVAVYPSPFKRLEDVATSLDSDRWVSRRSVLENEAKQKKKAE